MDLFRETWAQIISGEVPRIPQIQIDGTSYRLSDIAAIDRIDLDASYVARDLINILRARTFPPHNGAYFETANRRISMRLELHEEE